MLRLRGSSGFKFLPFRVDLNYELTLSSLHSLLPHASAEAADVRCVFGVLQGFRSVGSAVGFGHTDVEEAYSWGFRILLRSTGLRV